MGIWVNSVVGPEASIGKDAVGIDDDEVGSVAAALLEAPVEAVHSG